MSEPLGQSHVAEQTLILHYYGELDEPSAVEPHLAACATCRDEFERLQRLLALVELQEVPEPPPTFEREVWARLTPHLGRRGLSWVAPMRPSGRQWASVGAAAAILLAAFVAGRVSRPPESDLASPAVEAPGDVAGRVLDLAVGDHLDRSQMALIEWLNADFETTALDLDAEQSRARELIAANRLYRSTAGYMGDAATRDVLDELERVLLEIANTPPGGGKETLEALRTRIEARGLLFRVRVIHSELRQREQQPLNRHPVG